MAVSNFFRRIALCSFLFLPCLWYFIPKKATNYDIPFVEAYYIGLGLSYDNAWYGRVYTTLIHRRNSDVYAVVDCRAIGANQFVVYKHGRFVRRGVCIVGFCTDYNVVSRPNGIQIPLATLTDDDFRETFTP